MDSDRNTNLSEGAPLRSGATSIFLNTDESRKCKSDGAVIRLNADKPTDLGVHINTTLSIASTKKIKLLFIFNFMISIVCVVISCTVTFYYWNELMCMKKQMDTLKDQVITQSGVLNHFKPEPSALTSFKLPSVGVEVRESRMENVPKEESLSSNVKRYYVEDLGEDMLLVDSSKKNSGDAKILNKLSLLQKELPVIHFSGAEREINLGRNPVVGPWMRDEVVSSKNSETKIQLFSNDHSGEHYFSIVEGGLYMIYAQLEYLSNAPNFYTIWARQKASKPRLISSCGTSDVSTVRELDQSQVTCSVQTVARLMNGDTVNIAQREKNRTMWMKPGLSYIGFVKIGS